jgi:hypothetical protein
MRSDGEHRHAAAVCIKRAIDKMQISRPAAAGADSQFACHMRLTGSCECRALLMTHVDPFDLFLLRASVNPFRESPTMPSIRLTPDLHKAAPM